MLGHFYGQKAVVTATGYNTGLFFFSPDSIRLCSHLLFYDQCLPLVFHGKGLAKGPLIQPEGSWTESEGLHPSPTRTMWCCAFTPLCSSCTGISAHWAVQ